MNQDELRNDIREMVKYTMSDGSEEEAIDNYTDTFMSIIDKHTQDQEVEHIGCACNDIVPQSQECYNQMITMKVPKTVELKYNTPDQEPKEYVSVDPCIAVEVHKLWLQGIRTTGCCCGHNTHKPYIGVVKEDISKMKELGYKVQPHEVDKYREDSFIPKSIYPQDQEVEQGGSGRFRNAIASIKEGMSGLLHNIKVFEGSYGSTIPPLDKEVTLRDLYALKKENDDAIKILSTPPQKEGLSAEEILDKWLKGFNWPYWSKENAIKAMQEYANQPPQVKEGLTAMSFYIKKYPLDAELQCGSYDVLDMIKFAEAYYKELTR